MIDDGHTPPPRKGDPFFELVPDGEWNATVGAQGDEENYPDGYMEAALELLDAIFEKKLYGKRDTLILPILYNGRHALELTLKFATGKLSAAGIIEARAGRVSHNIEGYIEHLRSAEVGDQAFAHALRTLQSFVTSLAQIDQDGQELRYYQTRRGELSLADLAVINLRLVRKSMQVLAENLSTLRERVVALVDERHTNTRTSRCSRRDLLAICEALPIHAAWASPAFDKAKVGILSKFALNDAQFAEVLELIQSRRELRAGIGLESKLLHLTDDDLIWIAEQWRRLHPKRVASADKRAFGIVNGADLLEEILTGPGPEPEVLAAIADRLDAGKLAELEVLFYLSLNGAFSEDYERLVEAKLREHQAVNNKAQEIQHLVSKTTLLRCLAKSAFKVGRLSLSERLKDM